MNGNGVFAAKGFVAFVAFGPCLFSNFQKVNTENLGSQKLAYRFAIPAPVKGVIQTEVSFEVLSPSVDERLMLRRGRRSRSHCFL